MLDVKNPQIRVEDIMQRIQEKVRTRRGTPPPSAGSPAPVGLDLEGWQPVEETLARAQDLAQVGASVPAMTRMHGIRRALAGGVARVFLRVAQLITRDQRAFNLAALDILRTHYERLRRQAAQVGAVANDVAALRSELASLRVELASLPVEFASLRVELARAVAELQTAGRDEAGRIAVALGQLRTSMSLQERRLDLFLDQAGKTQSTPLDAGRSSALGDESAHLWDAVSLHFQDEFRGSREDIKRRVAVYVPKLRAAGAGNEAARILDLGCGRGELLEVLRAEGLAASGVDTNRPAVEQCRERGLSVELGDAFEALSKVPDLALGGLTAVHVVEHLPFPFVLKLIDEALRVLRPGGIVIFETPNPENVLVGSANFYIDPTHRNPVHPQTLKYLMEARGLVRVETLMLHPLPPEARVPADSELARRFNELFYGPQDYAAVGYRP